MGMFDHIKYQGREYQTKDTPAQMLDNYKIEQDAESGEWHLWYEEYDAEWCQDDGQLFGGNIIIKVDNIFYKPVVDMLYILSSLYEKVYITKPNTNNITSFDKYIVCKNFLLGDHFENYLNLNYYRLIIFIKKLDNRLIKQILNFEIPYYFKIKINDLNIIIGQQQLESLDQIITIYKNKNKEDKIESIKKSNIQKSVSWCEKYKIPCNKFTEKINIFLPIINETI
jgi:hypothetical protein